MVGVAQETCWGSLVYFILVEDDEEDSMERLCFHLLFKLCSGLRLCAII